MNLSNAKGSNLPAYADKAKNKREIRLRSCMQNRSKFLKRTFQTTLLRNIITDAPSTPGNLLLLSKKEIEEKLSGGGVFSRFENCRPLGP